MNFDDLANLAELTARKVFPVNGLEEDATYAAEYLHWQKRERKNVKRGMNRRSRRSVRQTLASAY
jgi:hypothetical protein